MVIIAAEIIVIAKIMGYNGEGKGDGF